MYTALLVSFIINSIGLVILIMLQQGKSTERGSSFGIGASSTLFGSSGSGKFITSMTALLAIFFFVLSLILGNLSSNQGEKNNASGHVDQQVNSKQINMQPSEKEKPSSDIP